MLVLLPPSESKREGGTGGPLGLPSLAFPELLPQRREVIDALVTLAEDPDAAARVLRLSDRQRTDIAHNRVLVAAPTMSAVDRYTGVLFDALDSASLDTRARGWLGAHVAIHSAPFGLIGALDAIPYYRLAAGVSLPGLLSMRRLWSRSVTEALRNAHPRVILDLRSEAYVALGATPGEIPSAYVRVVSGDGRALNHFNKTAKGLLLRRLAQERPRIGSLAGLERWARLSGVPLAPVGDEWQLRVGTHG